MDAPASCRIQIAANAPTDSWVKIVITTSGQCGSPGFTWTRSTGFAFGGNRSGIVIRVVEMLESPEGTPVPNAEASVVDARHDLMLTISTWMAPLGQAETHAGA